MNSTQKTSVGCLTIIIMVFLIFIAMTGNPTTPPKSYEIEPEHNDTDTEDVTEQSTDVNVGLYQHPASPNDKTTPYQHAHKVDICSAWTIMQEFVEDHLKCPSTAKWPWSYHNRVKYLGDSKYLIVSYVDAENSFGAKVRTYFRGVVRCKNDENNTWVLESLEFLNR